MDIAVIPTREELLDICEVICKSDLSNEVKLVWQLFVEGYYCLHMIPAPKECAVQVKRLHFDSPHQTERKEEQIGGIDNPLV